MARRKSFQRGTVIQVKNKSGTVYRLRYRKRNAQGGWTECTETLRDCPSEKMARKELQRRLDPVNDASGGLSTGHPWRFKEIVDTCWEQYLENQEVRESTRYAWASIVRNRILPFFGPRLLEEIQAIHIGEFMSQLKRQGLAEKYRRNIYGILKLMLEVAVDNDLMKASPIRPKIHRPKLTAEEKPAYSAEQVLAIIEAAEPPYRTPIAVLAMTGIRAGELLGLKWVDIDFLAKRMKIDESVWRGKLQAVKSAKSNRVIGMPDSLVALLARHRQHSQFTDPDDFVFCQADGRPINPDSLRKLGIYPALQKVGIPYRKRESGCHAFRHTLGSIVHRETGSLKYAQMQLGHSNIATTGDIYTHVANDEMDQVAKAIGKALSGFCGRSVVENVPEGERIQ